MLQDTYLRDLVNSGDHAQSNLLEVWDRVISAPKLQHDDFSANFYQKVHLSIVTETHHPGGTGSAVLSITTPNMRSILEKVKSFAEADNNKSFDLKGLIRTKTVSLLQGDCEMETVQVDVLLKVIKGRWRILPNPELYSAVTNDMASLFRENYTELLKEKDP